MTIRSRPAQSLLLALMLSTAVLGCKRGAGDDAATTGSAGSSSGNGAASEGSGAGSPGSSGAAGGGTAATAGAAIDDSVITTKLKTAILADSTLKGSSISVETRNGEVMLTGTVNNAAQKDHAASIAQALNGVKNVNNKLAVKK